MDMEEECYNDPIDMFVQPDLALELQCGICFLVPHQTSAVEHMACGKLFCMLCISKWWSTGKETCPMCNNTFTNQEMKPVKDTSMALYRIMGLLEVKCKHPPGIAGECKWRGTREKLDSHVLKCEYKRVPCLYDCKQIIARCEAELHYSQSCPNFILPCDYGCKEKVFRKDLKEHKEHCRKNSDVIQVFLRMNSKLKAVFLNKKLSIGQNLKPFVKQLPDSVLLTNIQWNGKYLRSDLTLIDYCIYENSEISITFNTIQEKKEGKEEKEKK